MRSIEWMHLVTADKLAPGDFALLLEREMEPALVVKAPDGSTLAALLGDGSGKCPLSKVEWIGEDAAVYRDWKIVVDHAQMVKFDDIAQRYGALVLAKNELSLVCVGGHGHGYVVLPVTKVDPGNETTREYAFPSWKIVKSNGDEDVTLYERQPPAP